MQSRVLQINPGSACFVKQKYKSYCTRCPCPFDVYVDVDVDLGFSKCTCCYASARSRCTLEHFANKLTNFFSHHLATLGASNHHTVSFYRLVVATFFPPLYSTQSLFPREIDCIVRFFLLFLFYFYPLFNRWQTLERLETGKKSRTFRH